LKKTLLLQSEFKQAGDEKDIPTFQQEKKEQARIPEQDGLRQRAQGIGPSQVKGKKEDIGIRRTETQGLILKIEMNIYG
jgi:hypothetical protein